MGIGNSHIRHSRAKVLGGCSSHNTLISFRAFERDMADWQARGAAGWDFATMTRLVDGLRNTIQPVHARHRNALVTDWIAACSAALGVPVVDDFNAAIRARGGLASGAGFFSVAYNPIDGRRSSASVAYLHPVLCGHERRPNLTVLTNAWVSRVNLSPAPPPTATLDAAATATPTAAPTATTSTSTSTSTSTAGAATGDARAAESVVVTLQSGITATLLARQEIVLCAGAIDTPRLLLLSGIGPRAQLAGLGVPVQLDVPGVGENLLDHAETIIMWELHEPMPPATTMDSDAGLFLDGDGDGVADLMMHTYQIPFAANTARLGYDVPRHAFCVTPNVPRPRSVGRLYLVSADPRTKPALDFCYFTDPAGHDARTLVDGLRTARRAAQAAPFARHLKREVAPGLQLQSDHELDEYARAAAHTVYHPAGTTKMGDLCADPLAVVAPDLRVRGVARLRIADAGIFPSMVTVKWSSPTPPALGVG